MSIRFAAASDEFLCAVAFYVRRGLSEYWHMPSWFSFQRFFLILVVWVGPDAALSMIGLVGEGL